MRNRIVISLCFFFVFLTMSVLAADNEIGVAPLRNGVAVQVGLTGEAQDGLLHIQARIGPGITRAIRVHSQPSNTLLAMYVNADDPAAVGTSWVDGILSDVARSATQGNVATVSFRAGADPVVTTIAPPAIDSYLRIWISGSWMDEDGVVREQERSFDVTTNLASFRFNFILRLEPRDGPNVIEGQPLGRGMTRFIAFTTVCCGDENDCLGQACASCSSQQYCCGKYTGSGCDWCTTSYITCSLQCSPCA
jgi:hypothetical protein